MKKSAFRNRQVGAAMVEATIVMPLLLLLFLAISEFGRVFYTYNTLNKALQAGARQIANTASGIDFDSNRTEAENLIVYGHVTGGTTPQLEGLSTADVDISSTGTGFTRIDVNYNYVPMIGPVFNPFGFGDPIDLNFTLTSTITTRDL